ncbi:MAG: class I SAM-dependent methyltransferase, partial [Spirochaetales bacterium]|nr:class I SAM-dependent methyltransferase [Spirochaetales bacterium]
MLIKDSSDWFKNEEFWKLYEPLMFDPDRMADTGLEVDGIIALADLHPNQNILDACCGSARHSVEFAKKGFNVTGVDITEAYLKEARENIKNAGVNVDLVKDDVRKFKKPSSYDFAMNYYTSFGYFDDPEDDLTFCKNICDSLKKGGSFLIDTIGKETVALHFK